MRRLAVLQVVGPSAVFLTVLMAEMAVVALAWSPSSALLWRLNLQWFSSFQSSHYIVHEYLPLPHAQLVLIALPLLLVAWLGLLFRKPLALAIASNLSVLYVALVVFSAIGPMRLGNYAALGIVAFSPRPDGLLLLCLGVCALVSGLISHAFYVGTIYKKP